MAKRPKLGKCVHCLNDPVERNWDHVFPESWYPDSTPANLYKWQVPSCITCNSELGTIEDEFLRLVALCLDPHDSASRSIVEKALRAMRPSAAKSPRDRNVRTALRQRVLDQMAVGEAIPETGIYPSLGEKWDRPRSEQTAVLIPADHFRHLTEKIVRGIFYVEDNKFIEFPYTVEFFALDSAGARYIQQVIERFGATYAREPGIIVRRAVTPEDGVTALFEIEFWKQFKTYAAVQDCGFREAV